MPRRRWLPENVTTYKDRHGKARYRFRKKGLPPYTFRHAPGSAEFMVEYEQARQGTATQQDRFAPFTYDALIASFYRTARWLEMRDSSQRTYRGIIERFREKNGTKDVRSITTGAIDRKLSSMADTPAAANNLRKALARLHRHAVKLDWRKDNPVLATDAFKKGKGWHPWSEDEIATFKARWPLGTRERLALELLLGTALRESDVVLVGRQHRKGDRLHLSHGKNDSQTVVPIGPDLQAAMDAFDSGNLTYLATQYGKPFTVKGFYNWFKRACVKAALPHCSPHGLRKAVSRRLAEAGATALEGRAVTGHKTDRMFAYYAESASKEGLASVAMGKVVANLGEVVSQKDRKSE
jgi:integrase